MTISIFSANGLGGTIFRLRGDEISEVSECAVFGLKGTFIFSANGLEGGVIFGLRGGEHEASELVLWPGVKGGALLGLEGTLRGP
jgi:hypothetical protein